MNAVLGRLGFPTHPTDSYRYLVGNGSEQLIKSALPAKHLDERTVADCRAAMRDEYSRRWAQNTKPYPGIGELLSTVEKLALPMTILSNKSDEFTQLTVSKLLPHWSFEIVRGARDSVPRKPDPTAALQIAEELSIPPEQFLYLGDTKTDMQTANLAGMYAVGALWGFRTAHELVSAGARVLAQKPLDVLELLQTTP